MADGYGQPPQQGPAQNQQVATQQQQGMYLDDGYDYYGNTFSRMGATDLPAQVRKALFEIDTPDSDTDFEHWINMFSLILDAAPRIPGISKEDYRSLSRRFADIVERAHSQGRKKVLASKCQTILIDMRLLVSVCDTPTTGLSGVGAMITTNQKQEQTIRMPQQTPQQQAGFWPWSRR